MKQNKMRATKKQTGLISMLMVLVVMTFASCNQEKPKEPVIGNQNNGSHYPVTINTYDSNKKIVEQIFEKAPEKVVVAYQNSIETMIELGLEDKIVLATGLDHDVKDQYKEKFEKIKYNDQQLSKEEVVALEPDMILGWFSLFEEKNLGEVSFWNDRGTNVYIAENSGGQKERTLENEYLDIENLGKIFDVEDKATELINSMKKEIEDIQDKTKEQEPVKALIIETDKEGMYTVYGEDSIGGDIAVKAGAEIVAKNNGKIGKEELLILNPDVIFTVYYGDEINEGDAVTSITNDSSLGSLSAIKNGRVMPIMLSEVYCSGVRTQDGIETIIAGLYPELEEKK